MDRVKGNSTILENVGSALGWKTSGTTFKFPSTKELAVTVGQRELYELIYEATSRSVHFSVFEVLRWTVPSTGARLNKSLTIL
jgi:hypothetical protein